MPCDTRIAPRIVKAAVDQLEEFLSAGLVAVKVDLATGTPYLVGWEAAQESLKGDIGDVCAIRKLQSNGSWAFQKALAEAEAMSGRRGAVANATQGGWHTHDSGGTWGKD